ncbi:MAG: helix-turn-helix transcriptional regulator [Methylobacteriaceae bacterium]|nr:helix-turn-helix transcriptional regulator [Methylobacteriaceae bacterium]
METSEILAALSALAHPARLDVWRRLAEAGPCGLEAGRLAIALDAPANTLSTQLAILTRAGLVRRQRCGRRIVYRARLDRVTDVATALTALCCGGRTCANASRT